MISFYPNAFTKANASITLEAAFDYIRTGDLKLDDNNDLKSYTYYLRTLPDEQYKSQKTHLPAVTFSGRFKDGERSINSLELYAGIVVIDIDKIDPSVIPSLKAALCKDGYTRACFVSPSGKGLKVVTTVNTDAADHRSAFLHLEDYYLKTYGIKVDKSGKDVCRLCFLSYDPEIYVASSYHIFEVDKKYGEIITTQTTDVESYKATSEIDKIFKVCVKWVERNKTYVEGERNVYLHALACALNRCGVKQEDTIKLIEANYPVPDQRWHQSVRSAYFHNQHEHGAVQVRDIGATDFVAPPYIANFTDDVAANDIMRMTAMMYHYKVPNQEIYGIVSKVANFYDGKGYIDLRRSNLVEIMNNAIAVLNQNIANNASQNKLDYKLAEDLGRELIDQDVVAGVVPTHIPIIDMNMRGGMQPSNFYGLMGVGGTFKSILAQFWAFMAAVNGLPVLYLNGEMSMFQFYDRMTMMAMQISLYIQMSQQALNKGNIEDFISQMKEITKNNLFFVNGSGFNENNVQATCDHIEATTGKKIRFIVVDGVTQMDSKGKEEIPAAIMNTGVCKEIAKKTNTVVVGLMHISGDQFSAKIRRDNGPFCRGGGKTIANMDGYFSTSLLIDSEAQSDNEQEIAFIPGKLYLRLVDKRSPAGVVNAILNVNQKNLHVEYEDTNPANYEVKSKNGRQS